MVVYCTTSGDIGSTSTWRNTLYVATLTGVGVTQRRLVTDNAPFCDQDFAYNKVVDENTIAEMTGSLGQSSLVLVDLTTGRVTPVGLAIGIDGVL